MDCLIDRSTKSAEDKACCVDVIEFHKKQKALEIENSMEIFLFFKGHIHQLEPDLAESKSGHSPQDFEEEVTKLFRFGNNFNGGIRNIEESVQKFPV